MNYGVTPLKSLSRKKIAADPARRSACQLDRVSSVYWLMAADAAIFSSWMLLKTCHHNTIPYILYQLHYICSFTTSYCLETILHFTIYHIHNNQTFDTTANSSILMFL